MPISYSDLRAAASRSRTGTPSTLVEARSIGAKTAFLCHSHKDKELVEGFVNLLGEQGWRVYIDWKDNLMPEKPNAETAERIQRKIKDLDYFLFLATSNSMTSRWCPWELGYADGIKTRSRIMIAPTSDGVSDYGSEYLGIYRRVDRKLAGSIEVWEPGSFYYSTPVKNI